MKDEGFADRFPLVSAVIQQGIERGLHHGAQVYIAQHGNVLADVGIGLAAPGVPMTAETVNPWLSAGKPLTAVVIARLQAAGAWDWDDRVATFLPEFGCHGKESITIRHLLTHTAGLGCIEPGWPDVDWSESIRRICAATIDPQWVIGETAGYDSGNSWFLLGEIAQRITGRAFPDVITERLFSPLGMQGTWCSLTQSDYAKSQANLGWMWEREQGQLKILDWHETPRCVRPSPGSGVRGPIRELGKFYEMLRKAGDGPSGAMLMPETVQTLTARQRVGKFDQTFGHIMDFGLGFLIDSNQYGAETVPYGYGRYCSPRTFGHGGSQSSQGYCDPDHGLVVAYVFNGRPGEPQHQRRARAFNEAVSRDLGLAKETILAKPTREINP